MKKSSEKDVWQGCVAGRKTIEVQCSVEESKQLREALAVIAKAEKTLKVNRKLADWTMIHSYRFIEGGFEVTVDQGACG